MLIYFRVYPVLYRYLSFFYPLFSSIHCSLYCHFHQEVWNGSLLDTENVTTEMGWQMGVKQGSRHWMSLWDNRTSTKGVTWVKEGYKKGKLMFNECDLKDPWNRGEWTASTGEHDIVHGTAPKQKSCSTERLRIQWERTSQRGCQKGWERKTLRLSSEAHPQVPTDSVCFPAQLHM